MYIIYIVIIVLIIAKKLIEAKNHTNLYFIPRK